MLTNLTVPLLGLVDTAVLGHLNSPEYLGAVAVGANLFSILYWTFGFMRMGTTGLAAQAWGKPGCLCPGRAVVTLYPPGHRNGTVTDPFP